MYNSDIISAAWQLAGKLHHRQMYGSAEPGLELPYTQHIGAVVLETLGALHHSPGMDPTLSLCCAILHDTLEDSDIEESELEAQFGHRIAAGVAALSKNALIVDKHQKMADSLMRIREQPHEIWAVKLADRIANLQIPPHFWTPEKKTGYLEESLWILNELGSGNSWLARRLELKISLYKNYI